MRKKLVLLVSALTLTVGFATVICTQLIPNESNLSNAAANGRDVENTLLLNADTATEATDTFASGSFSVATTAGNSVAFGYNYAKALDSGLLSIGKDANGNPDGSKYYVGNTDPITSLSSISVSFSENTTLMVYASYNGTNFYKVEILTASGSFTTANDYFYFRFVNANQDTTAIDITSITFNYLCSLEDYTDELSDMTSKTLTHVGSSASENITVDTTVYDNDFESSKSLKISANTDSSGAWAYGFSLPLPRSYSVSEIQNGSIALSYNTANNTDFDANHNFARLMMFLAPSASNYKDGNGKSLTHNLQVDNGKDWTTTRVEFNTFSGFDTFDSTASITHILIRPCYATNYINIDQMRFSFNSDYPEYAGDNLLRKANITDVNAALTIDNADGTAYGDGVKVTSTAAIDAYTRIFSLSLGDTYSFASSKANGASFSMYICAGTTTYDASVWKKFVAFQLCYNGTNDRATGEVRIDNAAVTKEVVDSTNYWIRVSVSLADIDAGSIDNFDRISFKLQNAAYLQFTAADQYMYFTSYSMSNLVTAA